MMPQGRIRRLAGPVFKYGLLAVILVWFVTSGQLRFDLFVLSEHFLLPLCLGVCLVFLSMLCAGVRYSVALSAVGVPIGIVEAIKAGFTGFFFSYCAMGTLSGDIMRGVYVSRVCPSAGERITAAIIGDRIVGLLSLVVICGLALYLGMGLDIPPHLHMVLGGTLFLFLLGFSGVIGLLVYRMLRLPGLFLAALTLGAMVLAMNQGLAHEVNLPFGVGFLVPGFGCVIAGLAFGLWASRLSLDALSDLRFASPGTVAGKVVGMVRALLAFKDSPRTISILLVFALCQHLTAILAIHQLAQVLALPDYPTLAQTFFATPLTFIINAIPLPGAGIGVHEVAFGALLAASVPTLGPAFVGGSNVYLLFRMTMTCLSFIGIPCYIGLKKRYGEGQ